MTDTVTDTHGLIWYLENSPRLGLGADQAFNAADQGEAVVYVPTICLVEIVYLQEKGRIPADLKDRFDAELLSGRSGLAVVALTAEIVDAVARIPRTIVADMPDRIIAATALHLRLPLISQDRALQKVGLDIIW